MISATRLSLGRAPAGIDILTRVATLAAGGPPQKSHAFLFTGKNCIRMRLLLWDRHDVWQGAHQLEHSTFSWLSDTDDRWHLTPEQFASLTACVYRQRLSAGLLLPRAE